MNVTLNEVFARPAGVSLRYDAFHPNTPEATPAVVCIHGGGWVSGCKTDVHEIARHFASSGFAAFCPQYRLAPLYPFPAAVEDMRAFVRFLRDNASSSGVLADGIGSFGNSAGGHLSAMLAMPHNDRVNAAVNVCGLVDLTNPMEQHPAISWDFINQFMACPYKGAEAKWIEASPLYNVSEGAAPMLIFHGSDDDIVWSEQSRRLHAAMQDAGAESELHILPGESHSFSEPAFREIMCRSIEFFEESLK